MSDETQENLKELLGRFLNPEDVRDGERILRTNPAPEPDKELISNIKAQIAAALERSKANGFRIAVYRAAAFAAVFMILSFIGVKLFQGERIEHRETSPIISSAIWEGGDLVGDDAYLAMLTAEAEQFENELTALELGENGGNGYRDLSELETELMEINSDFWKG